jgi:hypothetical protein
LAVLHSEGSFRSEHTTWFVTKKAIPRIPALVETAMVAQPKQQPARRKRRQNHPEEFVDYVMAVEDWDWSYWIAFNTLRDLVDPYNESRQLQSKGRLLRPTGMRTDRVEVSLFPSIRLEEERRKDLKPIAVGSLELHSDRIDGHLGIPSDVLTPVLQMLIAERLKFVLLRGSKFCYRSARLISYSLQTTLAEDDRIEVETN